MRSLVLRPQALAGWPLRAWRGFLGFGIGRLYLFLSRCRVLWLCCVAAMSNLFDVARRMFLECVEGLFYETPLGRTATQRRGGSGRAVCGRCLHLGQCQLCSRRGRLSQSQAQIWIKALGGWLVRP